MNRSTLERAVARATGESRRTIRHYGFSLVPDEAPTSEAAACLGIDCPGCGAEIALSTENVTLPELAECTRCDGAYPYAPYELYLADVQEDAVAACA